MQRTNNNTKENPKMGCPCQELNEKYSKGFATNSKSSSCKAPKEVWEFEEEIEYDNKKSK